MIKNMSDYEIIDFMLIDFIEAGDLISFAANDYLVKDISATDKGWDLVVVDRYEEEIDLFIPDNTVVGLLSED